MLIPWRVFSISTGAGFFSSNNLIIFWNLSSFKLLYSDSVLRENRFDVRGSRKITQKNRYCHHHQFGICCWDDRSSVDLELYY